MLIGIPIPFVLKDDFNVVASWGRLFRALITPETKDAH